MKSTRKIVCLSIMILSIFLFACDYQYDLYHEYIREETQVEKIELINYSELSEIESSSMKLGFDSKKLEVIDTLDVEVNQTFLSDLSKIGGLSSKRKQIMDSPNGKGIRITYIDGGFTLITVSNVDGLDCIFFGNFDNDEMVERYYGISWSEMINDFKTLIYVYFEYEIN